RVAGRWRFGPLAIAEPIREIGIRGARHHDAVSSAASSGSIVRGFKTHAARGLRSRKMEIPMALTARSNNAGRNDGAGRDETRTGRNAGQAENAGRNDNAVTPTTLAA